MARDWARWKAPGWFCFPAPYARDFAVAAGVLSHGIVDRLGWGDFGIGRVSSAADRVTAMLRRKEENQRAIHR